MTHRVLRTARSALGILVRPRLWAEARPRLGRAWRGSGGGGQEPGRWSTLVTTSGALRRATEVVVLLDDDAAQRLAPEWHQISWAPGREFPATASLAVAQWPATRDGLRPFAEAAKAAGVPLVVWDTAHVGATPPPELDAALVASDPERAREIGATETASGLVQPRRFNPVQSGGKVGERLVLRSGSSGSRLAPGSRRHDTVVLAGLRDGARQTAATAAATGAVVVVTDTADVPADLAIDGTGDEHLLRALVRHPELRGRYAQPAQRNALGTHSTVTAAERLLRAAGVDDPAADRSVSAVVPTMRPAKIDQVMEFVARQVDVPVQLVLVMHGFDASVEAKESARRHGVEDLVVVPADSSLTLGSLMNLGVEAADGRYVSKMDDDNYYGRHYLADLVRTFDYTDAQVTGKWAHFAYLESTGATFLRFPGAENRYTPLVQGGTLTLPRDVAVDVRFEDLPRRVDTTFLEKIAADGGRVYSADPYNFVSVRSASTEGHTWKISDTELLAKPSAQVFFGTPWHHVEV